MSEYVRDSASSRPLALPASQRRQDGAAPLENSVLERHILGDLR
jgi:hypothetical protein